ncbi:MAG: DUF1844 domain-containing protein [bacterium]|nr:DUF1844 domain-containing protein [bacterium]MDW8163695.1 DUF1844 domain-containing protein [Candidatus Omnitrophota bacterium]
MNFNLIVTFFAEMGWQSPGKIPNPLTGKIEKKLEVVKEIIELLEILKEKTKGNLTEEEDRFLNTTIANLQLNYVDEISKESKQNETGDKTQT